MATSNKPIAEESIDYKADIEAKASQYDELLKAYNALNDKFTRLAKLYNITVDLYLNSDNAQH